MYLLRQLWAFYRLWFVDYSDPRSDKLWLVSSPFPLLCLTSFYVWFSLRIGPKWMANRKPYNPQRLILVYNILQILGNAALLVYGLKVTYLRNDFDMFCENWSPVSDTSDRGHELVWGGVYYLWLKMADLMDTVFFVVRKQQGHISFLHVYHHAIMIFTGYMGARFIPGGNGAILVVINCFVHVFMYSYYMFVALEETRTAALTWKKHITQLQLVQFLLLGLHYSNAFFDPTCDYSQPLCFALLLQNLFMFLMFADFYRRNYLGPPRAFRPPKSDHSSIRAKKVSVQ